MKNLKNPIITKLIKAFFLLSIPVLLSACFPRPDPRWEKIATASKITPQIKDKVCDYLAKRSNELKSLRELSQLQLNSDDAYSSLRLSLVFQTPNQLRFEVLPPAAALSLFIASSTPKQTLLLEPTKKLATKIQDPQDLMAKLLKVRIPPQDFAYILSARMPPKSLIRICSPTLEENETKGIFFFNSIDGPGVSILDYSNGEYWTVSMQSGLLRTALLRRARDEWPVLAADFEEDDFSDPSQLYPRRIDLVIGNELLFATLEPTIVKFNTAIPESLFNIQIPEGYRIEQK